MRLPLATVLGLSATLCSCNDRPPTREAAPQRTAIRQSSPDGERVRIQDDCDPTTFNAVLGPGACVGKGETTFRDFIAELTATKVAEEWNFEDDSFAVAPGARITATNRGGETHTFTKVANFGGGFVPSLNALSGNPKPVPECSFPAVGSSFVPPGGSIAVTAPARGTVKFQCCIHPWMRAVATVEHDD